MLIEVLRGLRGVGVMVEEVEPEPPRRSDERPVTALEIVAGKRRVRFAVEEKQRAPYPNELGRLSARQRVLSRNAQPLLIVPFVSEALAAALTEAGWSWADAQGNFDLRAGSTLMLRQRRTMTAPKPTRKTLPQGSGSLAIIRGLIRYGEGEQENGGATALGALANVSQARASQVLRQLHELGLVERLDRGRWRPNREGLLDRFLTEYAGPRGSQRYLYGLDSPTEIAIRAAGAQTAKHPIVVSADVGPDLLLAWRRPSAVILYGTHEIAADELGLVEAQGVHDANVIIRHPEDRSVFPHRELVSAVRGVDVPLADPSQLIWDLQDLGGTDRLEAAGVLREWLLKNP